MIAIHCNALSKTYRNGLFTKREVRALTDVTFSVPAGQIFSLLGPNGAGKTTCIKILLSLTHSSSGDAQLLERPVSDARVRRHVGYLPENHRFPGYLTGEQVLHSFGSLTGIHRTVRRERVDSLLQLVGMAEWRGVKIKRYSKGMMQRLGLAQALINDPDLLFLDEPTDGVDPVGRKEIREVLKNLRDQGKTIFLNSHLLSEVELVSDRVAILDGGRLLRDGTVEELTTTGASYQISVEEPLPEGFLTEAAAQVLGVTPVQGGLTADVSTPHELNRVIDLLRRYNCTITAVSRQRSTLEDSFINLIKKDITS